MLNEVFQASLPSCSYYSFYSFEHFITREGAYFSVPEITHFCDCAPGFVNDSIFVAQKSRIPSKSCSPRFASWHRTNDQSEETKTWNRMRTITAERDSPIKIPWNILHETNKKSKDCRKTRKCSGITAPYQCYIKSFVPYRFKPGLKPKNAMNPRQKESEINVPLIMSVCYL